jgi:hypothetical protein
MSAMLWRFMDAVHPANPSSGGCAFCGDQDEFSPDVEAFELTGKLICSVCWEAECEANDHHP